MIDLLVNPSDKHSEGSEINTILQERIAKVLSGENANGHHPEPWLEAVLSGERAADDNFMAQYLREYRWIAALVADACQKENGEDTDILLSVADDALLEAAFDYHAQELGSENYIDYASERVSAAMQSWFRVPALQNPYHDLENKSIYSPQAEVQQAIIPQNMLPGHRQPEDIEVGSRILYYASVRDDASRKLFLLGNVSDVTRYPHRPKGYTPQHNDNPSPGLVHIIFDKHPDYGARQEMIADVNSCLMIPKDLVRELAHNEAMQEQWFNEGNPQLSKHIPEQYFINSLQQHVSDNSVTFKEKEQLRS